MDPTKVGKQKNTEPVVFKQLADTFFKKRLFQSITIKNKDDAEMFLTALDLYIKELLPTLPDNDQELVDTYTTSIGSFLGEMLCILFDGKWTYSEKQQRWVISCATFDKNQLDLNVFRKVENRFKNGEEDSISYFYLMNKEIVTGEKVF